MKMNEATGGLVTNSVQTQQLLHVAEVAATLSQRYTPTGVTNWLTDKGISEDRRQESALDLIQTGEIAIVKQAAEQAVR